MSKGTWCIAASKNETKEKELDYSVFTRNLCKAIYEAVPEKPILKRSPSSIDKIVSQKCFATIPEIICKLVEKMGTKKKNFKKIFNYFF